MNDVNTIIDMLLALPEKQRVEVMSLASDATKSQIWIPNPGPQTEAYFSDADELFYGGSAGGGKSDAGIGLALTQHSTSLLLRRTNKEALGLATRIEEIVGSRDGYNGSTGTWRFPDRVIDIGGCQLEDDKQKYKGNPHSLIFFDEVSDFSESQYTFINTWNRSTKPGERCRIVAAGNPPTRPEGLWVMKRWSAWLDQSHQRPAKPGEVRWYLRPDDGDEIEVDGKGPYEIDGRSMEARSRTFIPALLGDNPDLSATDYAAMLDSLPKELRDAYRDGKFNTMLADGAFQTIPSEWVMLAMDRWTDKPPEGVPMCAIGLDVAQGGTDLIVAAPRYDAWFAPLIKASGREVTTGAKAAGFVMSLRRDNALIIIDMGGGYGGACYEWLHDNDVPIKAYKGAEASTRRTLDRQLGFYNKRSEAYWLFREALDPGQPGGSQIALPFDRELIADLCAPTFTVGPRGIQVEPKESVCKRLKRSTDSGDAVVMSWSGGNKLENMVKGQWPVKGRNFKPKVITSGRVNPRR